MKTKQTTEKEGRSHNTGLAKVALQCSADTFVVNQTLVLRIEADNDVQSSELKFLQMAKAKLKVDEQTLIVKFPKQIDHLLDFHNYGLHQEFTDELKFE